MSVRKITIEQFHAELKAQNVAEKSDLAFKCPMCGTVQSGRDLIAAGAGKTFEEVKYFVGFSCVGRWTNAGAPREAPDGKPCNWTLGGLVSMHELEVIDREGVQHPHFELASPDEAQRHAKKGAGNVAA